ncbi:MULTISPECIES: tRNA (adenosine(37)-N6)-dimethylallyltransferase MiaA [Acidithiobacillus]|jgi:tRNA dimethylallyltransferase|uniref:tRNA dimethylallyltransferase n=5 Tax=Acidithiobacillus caldus TaxID=33059 RepID=F9ZNY0_ACICS|nr:MULTISPECIES: tRNA (adenosine(37)-N6)-dimethylallyltransferase MiaA [Acidithiobacillus]AEK57960.1 tRNA delta(2)-isopentenylpyrophosphate transferase [Acidithiobacillus caldus SM-1]AIA54944.1 tRNA dimethylallyltransferase [Acidithiobacillus caldus ATCC 51756]AUW32625.1 tRNA (adenosine(37)-N6)-dimethylallyltransferase MiaA [Acidithiobacillus caldus]MBU2728646.1 tRNA (adenosine(37)-N6)-dimethylallyltransferase MiaA [Acidithiobacillus caldus]MBU2734524.1 tRNA (adenosine(37)-N6)-dimethylallyltra
MIPTLFLMGPTASGKTDLALALADLLPVSIISVDSLLVYRHFDCGSAKPSLALRARYPHALIDIREPESVYSAGDFCRDARIAIDLARAQGRIPVLVGGTGLYFRALERGIAELPGASAEFRAGLSARAEREGWPALHAELEALDPARARRIDPHDRQRIQRALEIHRLGGSTQSGWSRGLDGPILKVALCPPRAVLHQRIAMRLDAMLASGFLEEVERLYHRYGEQDLPAMRAVGYRQFFSWRRGEIDLEAAKRQALAATRQLAKRQETWLRAEVLQARVDPRSSDAAAQILKLLKEAGTEGV